MTFSRPEPVELPPATFVLELTEHEAQYVYAALIGVSPVKEFEDGGDPVYDALGIAFEEAGIEPGDAYDYAAYNGNLRSI